VIGVQIAAIVLVGVAATAVVLARDPRRLVLVNGVLGLALTLLFVVFQAPDVALSMLVVGAVAYPLILLIAISVVSRDEER
jgi:energy-converting hydrogenase B subunit D